MTSLLSTPGKYRSRKEWSTSSIPTLVSLEEETNPVIPYSNGNGTNNNNFIQVNDSVIRKFSDSLVPSSRRTIFEEEKEEEPKETTTTPQIDEPVATKPEKWRRKSMGLSLLSGRHSSNSNSNNQQNKKRRSSIAEAILGRYKHKDTNGQSAVEKYNRRQLESSDVENDPPTITVSEDYDMKEKKRRKSSWQAKLERRRRKDNPAISDADIVEFNTNGTNYLDQVDQMEYRQKRHSWWNIFVPDNLKNR